MNLPILRTSERSDFKRCPWKWYHGWVEGLTEVMPRPTAADFGSGLHLCLAEWYIPGRKRGKDPRKTWEKWMDGQYGKFVRVDDLADPEHDGQAKYEDARELGLIILEGYLKQYGRDRHIEVIAPEQRFSIRIPHPNRKIRRAIVRYVGTFDLVYRDLDTGAIYVLDSKSTNKNLERFLMDVSWSEQFMGYSAVATASMRRQKLIEPNERVHGFTYNLLARKKPDDRPIGPDGFRHNQPQKKHYLEALAQHVELSAAVGLPLEKMTIPQLQSAAKDYGIEVFGDVSARQSAPLFLRDTILRTAAENRRQVQRIGEEALHMRAVRNGRLPILKNPTVDCGWQCDFKGLCEIDENNGDYEYFRDTVFEKHDPYADHREGAENSKTSVAARKRTGVK